MRKSIHSESEIVKSVRELESGVPADQICRRLNISVSTLYQLRKKYSGLDASQLKRLKELEEENSKLKKMYADQTLEIEILREVIEKNLKPGQRKEISQEIIEKHSVSISLACCIMNVTQSICYYHPKKDDSEVEAAIGQRAAMSIPAERVVEFLEEMIWEHGKPKNIRCRNLFHTYLRSGAVQMKSKSNTRCPVVRRKTVTLSDSMARIGGQC